MQTLFPDAHITALPVSPRFRQPRRLTDDSGLAEKIRKAGYTVKGERVQYGGDRWISISEWMAKESWRCVWLKFQRWTLNSSRVFLHPWQIPAGLKCVRAPVVNCWTMQDVGKQLLFESFRSRAAACFLDFAALPPFALAMPRRATVHPSWVFFHLEKAFISRRIDCRL